MIFISDVQNYVPIKLCKTAGIFIYFIIIGILKAENIKLNKNYLWDTLEIDWKEVTVTFNSNKIDLPKVVIIRLQDKIKVRRLMNREPLLFHLMLKQGITWFTLAAECNFLHGFFRCCLPVETVDMDVRITLIQGTHTFRKDRTCQVIRCNPWSTRHCPTPLSLRK